MKGGFVSNEDFSKDDPKYLYNQSLSYELILEEKGNFSAKNSDKDEAF